MPGVILTRRRIAEGETYPDGYGLAWRSWETGGAVCYPVPFNWVAGWLHDFWLDLRTPAHLRRDVRGAGEHYAAFRRGYEAGIGQARLFRGR